jgi:phosphomannomutase
MSIFKAYDVRGVYPEEINENIIYAIGQALVVFLQDNNLLKPGQHFLIGRDVRNSSPLLAERLIAALNNSGYDVDFAGIVGSDIFYYGCATGGYAAGIMVTASHNPAHYNGLKIVTRGIDFIAGEDLQRLEGYVQKNAAHHSEVKGQTQEIDLISSFSQWFFSPEKPLALSRTFRVVFDPGNGTVGGYIEKMLAHLPVEATIINQQPDGTFPGRGPDPAANHTELSYTMGKFGADIDFGVAWDNDSDRIVFFDERGWLIEGDIMLSLLAQQALEHTPGGIIVYDCISSKGVAEVASEHGGSALPSRVGHAFIKKLMKENNAVLGGEVSQHFYFKNQSDEAVWYAENTWQTLVNILTMLDAAHKPLSACVAGVTRYFKKPVTKFEAKDSAGLLAVLRERFAGGKQDELDGLTVEYEDWWFNVRPSNTEPVIKMVVEARSEDRLEEKFCELTDLIEQF